MLQGSSFCFALVVVQKPLDTKCRQVSAEWEEEMVLGLCYCCGVSC